MYYIYGVSVPSLLIESTDSMISACAFLWLLYVLDNVVITGCTDDNLGSVQFQSKCTLSRVYVPLA